MTMASAQPTAQPPPPVHAGNIEPETRKGGILVRDDELKSIASIISIFDDLEEAAKPRVMAYLSDRYRKDA